jgi:hypothetical protein
LTPRVLIACIKYLSQCPCPRCLLHKSKIPRLGSKSDIHARHRLIRVDSHRRRKKIEIARRLIFEGVNIASQKIEKFLGPESLTPTRVCLPVIPISELIASSSRMPSQKGFSNMDLISIRCSCLICYMSLNSECGRRHSLTLCVFYMPMETIPFRI